MKRRSGGSRALRALGPIHPLPAGRVYLGVVVDSLGAPAVSTRLGDAGYVRQHHQILHRRGELLGQQARAENERQA